jgi:hypothetical protein
LNPLSPTLSQKVKGAQHRKILDVQFITKAKNGKCFQPFEPIERIEPIEPVF